MLNETKHTIHELEKQAFRLRGRRALTGAEGRVLETCRALVLTAEELQRWMESKPPPPPPGYLMSEVADMAAAARQMVAAANRARFDLQDAAASAAVMTSAGGVTSPMTSVLRWWDKETLQQLTAVQCRVSQALKRSDRCHTLQQHQLWIKTVAGELRRFCELCQRLAGDLRPDPARDQLSTQLTQLHLCSQLLPCAALAGLVPNGNLHHMAMASRIISESVAESVALLTAPERARPPPDPPGGFVSSTDTLLQLLHRCTQEEFGAQVQPPLEQFLSHAMAVASCCGDEQEETITKACQQVLERLSAAAALQAAALSRRGEFVLRCQMLADQLEMTEHFVNTGLLSLIVEVFTEPTLYLDATIRLASEQAAPDSAGHVPENTKEERRARRQALDAAVADHDLFTDKMFQVCGLAIACSTDVEMARRVRSRLLLVEALEPEVAPSAAFLSGGGIDGLVKQPVADLRTLWRRALLEVRDCLDRVMDPTAFCQSTETALALLVAELKKLLYDREPEPLLTASGRVMNCTLRLTQFVMDQAAGSEEVTEAVLLVNAACGRLRACAAAVRRSPEDLGGHRLLLKLAQVVVSYVGRLRLRLQQREDRLECDDMVLLETTPPAQPANVSLLSDVREVPLDCSRTLRSRTRSRLAASSRTFSTELGRSVAPSVTSNGDLSLDITKYLSCNHTQQVPATPRVRPVRVDLTPLLRRASISAPPPPPPEPALPQELTDLPEEMLAAELAGLDLAALELGPEEPELVPPLDAAEVAAELSALSLTPPPGAEEEAQSSAAAAGLSGILDSLSSLAAELSQDVRDTEALLHRPPPPPVGVAAEWRRPRLPCGSAAAAAAAAGPAYVTADSAPATLSVASCGGGGGALSEEEEVNPAERSGYVPFLRCRVVPAPAADPDSGAVASLGAGAEEGATEREAAPPKDREADALRGQAGNYSGE